MDIESMGSSTQKPSRRLLWVGVAVVVAVISSIAVVSYLLVTSTKKETAVTQTSVTPTVATKEQVIQNLATLDSSIKQAAIDQAAVKDAIKVSENQPKLGN
ncbi:MAG: hypothetical protein WAW80_01220 [Candidatus Saccharimonadales bacterium]